jgi:hypothetical protein
MFPAKVNICIEANTIFLYCFYFPTHIEQNVSKISLFKFVITSFISKDFTKIPNKMSKKQC